MSQGKEVAPADVQRILSEMVRSLVITPSCASFRTWDVP